MRRRGADDRRRGPADRWLIYLDTCALVKLVCAEESSADLVAWLADHEDESMVSSMLADIEQPYLRSLDAIHLATATTSLRAMDIQHFVSYDKRLLQAAAEIGLPALRP